MASLTSTLTCLFLVCTRRWLCGAAPCDSSGFGGCAFNIMGAAGSGGKLTGYAPKGIEQFAYKKGGTNTNLAYLCEGNTVAILYDCDARIPLYAATVMTGAQLNGPPTPRPNVQFQPSGDRKLDQQYQQNDMDYDESNSRKPCYESAGAKYFVDPDWFGAANPTLPTVPSGQVCVPAGIEASPVHKGHLIAARYGRGDVLRTTATFTYTNVVPQFGVFNSGKWNADEGKLVVKWGQENCVKHGGQQTRNARMYVVVGAIPSTFGTFKPRFFGQSGFSDYQGTSGRDDTYDTNTGRGEYRVNVPRYMWTAVCCTFQYQDAPGQWKDGVKSEAFYRENEPGREPNYRGSFAGKLPLIEPIVIFPNNTGCNY